MTQPSDQFVYFPCRRCFSQLRARAVLSGSKRRCPRCQLVQEVPAVSRGRRQGEQYAVWDGEGPPPAADQLTAVCPVCGTRVEAPAEEAGGRVACPDCGTPVEVHHPPASMERRQAVSEHDEDLPADPEGEYPVCEEVDGPAASEAAAGRTYIPVFCPLCRTLMQAAEEQVGRTIVCPDCGTPTLVPAPRPRDGPERRPSGADRPEPGEYGVFEGVDQPPAGSRAVYGEYVRARCPVCHTLMYFTQEQVGQKATCPDCDTTLKVPVPSASRGRSKPAVAKPGSDPAASAPAEPAGFPRSSLAQSNRRAARRERRRGRTAIPPPPPWPLISGVFTYPMREAVRARWMGYSVWIAVALFFFTGGMTMVGELSGGGLGAAGQWIVALAAASLGGGLGLMWAASTSAFGVAIITATSHGDDDLAAFAEEPFIDRLLDGFYFSNSLAMSVGVVYAASLLLGESPATVPGATGAGLLVLLPVVLLSMLEAGSPLQPFSAPVWRSLVARPAAWFGFLALSALLWAATAWLSVLFASLGRVAGICLIAPLLTAALLIYFRLLGRLARCCAVEA